MKKEQKNYIRFELKNYKNNVKMLQGHSLHTLISTRVLQYTCIVTEAISLALAEMSAEVAETVRLKYFSGVRCDNFDLSYKLNVSERTVRRWDNIALTMIGRQLGMVDDYEPLDEGEIVECVAERCVL